MAGEKNPIISAVLSFIIPGLGQAYCGKIKKGAVLLVAAIIGSFLLFIPGLLVWLFGIYDAYMEAQGKPVWKFD
jgi:TM2 domain-containing membrane protein YozV